MQPAIPETLACTASSHQVGQGLFSDKTIKVMMLLRPKQQTQPDGISFSFLQRTRCISYGNSVRLSVRLSVRHTPVLCQKDGT